MARRAKLSKAIEWPGKSGIRIRNAPNRKRIKGVLTDFGMAHVVNYEEQVCD